MVIMYVSSNDNNLMSLFVYSLFILFTVLIIRFRKDFRYFYDWVWEWKLDSPCIFAGISGVLWYSQWPLFLIDLDIKSVLRTQK